MARPRQLADPARDGTLSMLDLRRAPQMPTAPGVTLRAATADDAPALQDAMEASGVYPDDIVVSRLRKGRRPYVAELDGLIASYGWVARSAEPIGDLGIDFRVAPDEAYIYDCATRPAYRGRGLYPAVLRLMAADLHRLGLRRVWIATAPGNVASQRGIVRAGFTKVADVKVTRRPGGVLVDLYGVPGVPADVLSHGAWSFHGRAHPDTGIEAGRQ